MFNKHDLDNVRERWRKFYMDFKLGKWDTALNYIVLVITLAIVDFIVLGVYNACFK